MIIDAMYADGCNEAKLEYIHGLLIANQDIVDNVMSLRLGAGEITDWDN